MPIIYGRIAAQKERVMMFEIGDKVVVAGMAGRIVNWEYDEGNVWIVVVNGITMECADCELTPA